MLPGWHFSHRKPEKGSDDVSVFQFQQLNVHAPALEKRQPCLRVEFGRCLLWPLTAVAAAADDDVGAAVAASAFASGSLPVALNGGDVGMGGAGTGRRAAAAGGVCAAPYGDLCWGACCHGGWGAREGGGRAGRQAQSH